MTMQQRLQTCYALLSRHGCHVQVAVHLVSTSCSFIMTYIFAYTYSLLQASQKLAAKDAECAELMAMCDQLLAQQEAGRGSEDTAGVMDQAT